MEYLYETDIGIEQGRTFNQNKKREVLLIRHFSFLR